MGHEPFIKLTYALYKKMVPFSLIKNTIVKEGLLDIEGLCFMWKL